MLPEISFTDKYKIIERGEVVAIIKEIETNSYIVACKSDHRGNFWGIIRRNNEQYIFWINPSYSIWYENKINRSLDLINLFISPDEVMWNFYDSREKYLEIFSQSLHNFKLDKSIVNIEDPPHYVTREQGRFHIFYLLRPLRKSLFIERVDNGGFANFLVAWSGENICYADLDELGHYEEGKILTTYVDNRNLNRIPLGEEINSLTAEMTGDRLMVLGEHWIKLFSTYTWEIEANLPVKEIYRLLNASKILKIFPLDEKDSEVWFLVLAKDKNNIKIGLLSYELTKGTFQVVQNMPVISKERVTVCPGGKYIMFIFEEKSSFVKQTKPKILVLRSDHLSLLTELYKQKNSIKFFYYYDKSGKITGQEAFSYFQGNAQLIIGGNKLTVSDVDKLFRIIHDINTKRVYLCFSRYSPYNGLQIRIEEVDFYNNRNPSECIYSEYVTSTSRIEINVEGE